MGSDGILGRLRVLANHNSSSSRSRWLRKRERWLVVLGVVLHAVYMLSIFDIYFKTPIVHGVDPVTPRFKGPAKRLILLIADGLRADKFFEPDPEGRFRAPFLRSIIKERGRWGVSHARPPTESRPGHVAIIAGFYEDPSAVTKGWKANPVEFDSVFNRSRHTFAFGSPDIIPIFCAALPHSSWNTYPHEFEDFATDASFLDEWSFDQFEKLLNRSSSDLKLMQLLSQDNLVIFLHLLGCDSNGHAHKPYSSIYLNNVRVVDDIARRVYDLVEGYFKDNRTAYIFTADHGMSDKGSHGDGHRSNTDTPLVAWGAGIKGPQSTSRSSHHDYELRFVDEHEHDMPTPLDWSLNGVERVDVNQADIAPLMSSLLGLPCPIHSVGTLPLGYISMTKEDKSEAVLANTKQVLNQFIRKSQIKQQNSIHFKPFQPLSRYNSLLDDIEHLISIKHHEAAINQSLSLKELAIQGLNYFQTYDWFFLMTIITLGYTGWMIHLVIHMLQSYSSLQEHLRKARMVKSNTKRVYLLGCSATGLAFMLLFLQDCPPLYHAYTGMTILLWTKIFTEYGLLKELWAHFSSRKYDYLSKFTVSSALSLSTVEILVKSFTDRRLYTWCFLIVGVMAAFYLFHAIPWKSFIPFFVLLSCWCLSIFTLMPAEISENTGLVVASGGFIIMIGAAGRWLDLQDMWGKYWISIISLDGCKPGLSFLFYLQVLLVGLSSLMVFLTTSHRTRNQELHFSYQFLNWSIAGVSLVLPIFSGNSIMSRLTSIFLGFAPAFLLLSIGYEAVFYSALSLVLMAWVLVEHAHLHPKRPYPYLKTMEQDGRLLQLSDLRVPLIFMLLFNVAFFGTGNFASIASFEISSVYRFVTVFSPFIMAALLIFKLLIPFILVVCVFSAVTELSRIPRAGCYFLVILFSDIMTLHFFFMVRNTGSWMEIGNSISHFGIMSAQVVFVLVLFAITDIYTKDMLITTSYRGSEKLI